MVHLCARFVTVAATWIASFGGSAQAQPVLIGCTGSLANQPQTTARIVDVDLATGLASNPRNTGIYAMGGIAFQPSTGILFGLTSVASFTPRNTFIRIDLATGGVTFIGPTGLTGVVEGDLAFNPVNGLLYGAQDTGITGVERSLFTIDPATGLATVISNLPLDDVSALAFTASGTLMAIDTGSIATGISRLATIDPNTGAILNLQTLNVDLGGGAGLAFHPISGIAYVADGGGMATNSLYQLDTSNGFLTPIGQFGFTGGVISIAFAPIPEPNSICLYGISMFAMTLVARKRRNRCLV